MKVKNQIPKLNRFTQMGILLVLTFVVYSNTLKNGFVIEDPIYITDWKLTWSLGNIPKMFAGDTSPTENIGVYRPMRGVFYALSYKLWGGTSPTFYHIQALLVHLGVTILVYLIVDVLVVRGPVSSFLPASARSKQKSLVGQQDQVELRVVGNPSRTATPRHLSIVNGQLSIVPLITALLFGLHPVHTEAVDYLTASFDTAAYVFFFGSFFLYLKANDTRMKIVRMHANVRIILRVASVFLAGLAFFHFEMTLTLPLLLILADQTLIRRRLKLISADSLRYVPYFALAFVYLFVRVAVLGITARSGYLEGSFYLTILTMLKVFLRYIQMLVFPVNLSINPRLPGGISAWPHPLAYMERISSQSIFEPIILLSLLVLAGLILAVVYFKRRQPFVSFSIGWFLISLLPVSYIIPQNTIFQERYIYIASFGYILLLVFLFDYFYTHKVLFKIKNYAQKILPVVRAVLVTLIILVATFYGLGTYFRNKDWKDSLAVWSKLAKQYPEDVIANFDTANLYAQRNNLDQAVSYYQKALAIEPRLYEARFGLGEIYEKQGKFDQAATEYQQAILINPQYSPSKEALDRINNNKVDIWKECRLSNEVTFFCPQAWITLKNYGFIKIKDPQGDFIIELTSDSLGKNQSIDDYLKSQRDNLGQLANEGLAQIPNFDQAYVKVWKRNADSAEVLLQFFLFREDKVIKILVYPADSPLIIKFDRIVSSITVD